MPNNYNLHKDTSYKYRWDQKELLRKILSGTLDEDLYINIRIDKDISANNYWKQNPIFRGTCFNNLHKLYINVTLGDWIIQNDMFASLFQSCKNITEIILEIDYDGTRYQTVNMGFAATVRDTIDLEKFEIRGSNRIRIAGTNYLCLNSQKLKTVIFRNNNLIHLGGEAAISNLVDTLVLDSPQIVSIPSYSNITSAIAFAQDGTGGTIYIPKSLYDHLGDGSEYDYKSATNWSTIDSYGTITWAPIEGSEYELT